LIIYPAAAIQMVERLSKKKLKWLNCKIMPKFINLSMPLIKRYLMQYCVKPIINRFFQRINLNMAGNINFI
jgi:hypothetical protein